jgi:hypothetical protein
MVGMKTLENISLDTDDDAEEESSTPKRETARPLHNLPGISLETKQEPKPEKRLSLSEIFEKMSARPLAAMREKPIVAESQEIENSIEAADWESEDEPNLPFNANVAEVESSIQQEDEPRSEIVQESIEQPEASQPEEEQNVDEELLATGLGAEGPPEPPEIPPSNGAEHNQEPEEPEPGPVNVTTSARGAATANSPWYNAAALDMQTRDNNQKELDDTAYYAEKRGVRRGLTAGLLFGWMFGKRGKKKQAAIFKQNLKTKDKQITNLQNEQAIFNKRIDNLNNAKQREKSAQPKVVIENAPNKVASSRPLEVANTKPQPIENRIIFKESPPSKLSEKARKIANVMPIASVVDSYPALKEAISTHEAASLLKTDSMGSEVLRESITYNLEQTNHLEVKNEVNISQTVRQNSLEKQQKLAKIELPAEDRAIKEELYEVPEGSKVEVSAWHRIELDQKTGKPVSAPEVAYGEEFRQEQRQEVWREDNKKRKLAQQKNKPDVKINGGGAMAGQLGGLATSSFESAPSNGSFSTPRSPSSNASMQPVKSMPIENEHVKHLTVGGELLRHASSPLVWVTAIVIVIALFIFGILR